MLPYHACRMPSVQISENISHYAGRPGPSVAGKWHDVDPVPARLAPGSPTQGGPCCWHASRTMARQNLGP
jgi:hypothetical protein